MSVTRAEFAQNMLGRVCAGRLGSYRATLAWFHAESANLPNNGISGQGAKWNPLGTTIAWPNTTNYNSVGVKNFASFKDGVDATVKTLQLGPYVGVLQKMREEDVSAVSVLTAIADSPWSGAPPNPEYLELLLERLNLILSDIPRFQNLPVGP